MRAFLRRRQPRAGGAPLAILGVFMKHPSFPLLLALVGDHRDQHSDGRARQR
jgi:hypothetical protein